MYIYTLHRCCWDCLVCPDPPPPPGLPMNQKRARKTKILPVVPVVNHVFQVADYRITTQIFQIVPFFGASGSDRIWIRHNAKRLGHSYRSTKLEPDIYILQLLHSCSLSSLLVGVLCLLFRRNINRGLCVTSSCHSSTLHFPPSWTL